MSELTDFLNAAKDKNGLSLRQIADAANVSPTTVQNLLNGVTKRPDEQTVRAVADALRISGDRAVELAGVQKPEPFLLPVEADRLDPGERKVIVHMVRQLLISGGKLSTGDDASGELGASVTELRPGTATGERPRVRRAARLRPRPPHDE
ncbi:helix-turn-helix domain-containing protein [Umezawaea tangerina]|uniref:helix-turn-helix domain-containing protein n=1 Tax=Umezawaea tangerina TaxID=84725 RepID=UPI0014751311|nr:helix-turn-helix transcriptional regulator [Umezawaea tangerina]